MTWRRSTSASCASAPRSAGSSSSPAGRRPRFTGRSTVCQEARTERGLRTRARTGKESAKRGRRAAKSALCFTSRVKRGESAFPIAISPHSPRSRRRPASVRRAAPRLSSRRPSTCTEGARRSLRIRALTCPANSPMRSQAPEGVSIPPNARRRMGSESATVSGRLPASRQHSEVPARGTPLNSHVLAPSCRKGPLSVSRGAPAFTNASCRGAPPAPPPGLRRPVGRPVRSPGENAMAPLPVPGSRRPPQLIDISQDRLKAPSFRGERVPGGGVTTPHEHVSAFEGGLGQEPLHRPKQGVGGSVRQ